MKLKKLALMLVMTTILVGRIESTTGTDSRDYTQAFETKIGEILPIEMMAVPLGMWLKIDLDLVELDVFRKYDLTSYLRQQAMILQDSAERTEKALEAIESNAEDIQKKYETLEGTYKLQIRVLSITTGIGLTIGVGVATGILTYALLNYK